MIDNYSRVRLLTDKYQAQGAGLGALGYVIEVYDTGDCEVEFSGPNGTTYAQVVAKPGELQVDEPSLILEPADVNLTTQEITYITTSTGVASTSEKPKAGGNRRRN